MWIHWDVILIASGGLKDKWEKCICAHVTFEFGRIWAAD